MAKLEGQVFEFGDFVLAPRERLLLRNGGPVALTGKAFDVLCLLVRRHGHLVSKEELLDGVWRGVVVEEVNLTVSVSAIRKVLQAPMIETVSGHGYRFTAPVRGADTLASDAWRAYLLGRNAWGMRSESGLRSAIDHFRSALEIDPHLALAESGLADSYATLGYLSHLAPGDAFPAARQHAERALAMDPSLTEAHASLGFVKLYFDWDWNGAESSFLRAITLDPENAVAHQWYSVFLLAAGRLDDSLVEIHAAHRREPLSPAINTDLGFNHYYEGRYQEAVKQLDFTLSLRSDYAPARLWLGRSLQELRRYQDALDEYARVEALVPDWPVVLAARGFVAAAAGRRDEAIERRERLNVLSTQRYVTPYAVALLELAIGRKDAAFDWLDRTFLDRSNWLVWLRLDPRWAALRGDRRFAGLIGRMRFPPLVNRSRHAAGTS
jgi:DNA-binding winged helix-turn-helix (wHTH) protein/Tfp pilus assembly protein PilF